MRATAFVVHCRRLLEALNGGQAGRAELASYMAATAELLDGPADVVILAVPSGAGDGIVEKLLASNRPVSRKPPARYISEAGRDMDELGDLIAEPPTGRARGIVR